MKENSALTLKCLIACCTMFIFSGCSTTMRLQYVKPPVMEMDRGEIYVVLDDQRAPAKGGDDPTIVGTVRNTFGMPFPLKSSDKRNPSMVIKELVSDCLKTAGYQVAAYPGTEPQLSVALQTFWSDGYQHSRIWSKILVQLKKDESSQAVWQHLFESNIGATWTAGYGPFDRAINSMLEDLKDKMIITFKGEDFNTNLKSLGGP